ncbi:MULTISPECIES: phosphotransferase [unclassified Ruegeria]|uniref:phosphotransferase n=1 Tax=unclassified Ruegeria TaxID=2625375 RepID=UPI001489BC77|nr:MULTISPECIES: phosphotransferase [unclassified Ruegeria]NOD47147.1 phosphotransferase [Ruegeria sp. HKCCD5849]NOD51470.1 phosphotransferase [Ruegeria sp. HKCCD5851]NOD69385.1 phosphotransferase [Ruegeria sp. HKCCD7303]NOE36001.1 phosphotransferase [Ruegeria sp. HKCCD7318]
MRDKATDVHIAIDHALRAPYQRVTLCQTPQGRSFWLKRVERFAPHLWLVKGKPENAFDRDRSSHRFLWNFGAPVPRIVAESKEYIAVEDAGASLTRLCADMSITMAEKLRACRAAGQALARLHAMGFAHGRPAFRDMCWDGRQMRFIDFEYFVPTKAGRLRKARDLGIAVLSALTQGRTAPRYAFCILAAYYEAWGRKPKSLPVLFPVPVRSGQSRLR